jgi:hypothetical protein
VVEVVHTLVELLSWSLGKMESKRGFSVKPILPFFPKARMNSAFCAGHRQVFGLAGSDLFLLAVASQFAIRTSA